jgi:hypothetical protein
MKSFSKACYALVGLAMGSTVSFFLTSTPAYKEFAHFAFERTGWISSPLAIALGSVVGVSLYCAIKESTTLVRTYWSYVLIAFSGWLATEFAVRNGGAITVLVMIAFAGVGFLYMVYGPSLKDINSKQQSRRA